MKNTAIMPEIKELYPKMNSRHQKDHNEFKGIGFAFSNKQFTEMCTKLKIKEENAKEKLFSIGGGGYILKDRSKAFHDMIDRHHEEAKEAMLDSEFAYSAFNYELGNHEYIVTYSVESTLDSLGLSFEDINSNKMLYEQLQKAKKYQIENSCWN